MSDQMNKIWNAEVEESMKLFLDTIKYKIDKRELKIDCGSIEYFRESTQKILDGIEYVEKALSQYETNKHIEIFQSYLDMYTKKVIEQNQQFVKKHTSEYEPDEYESLILTLRDYIRQRTLLLPQVPVFQPDIIKDLSSSSVTVPVQTLFDGIYNNPVYKEVLSKMDMHQKGKLIHIAGQYCPSIMQAEPFPKNNYNLINGSIFRLNAVPDEHVSFSRGDEFFIFYVHNHVILIPYGKTAILQFTFYSFLNSMNNGVWKKII